RGLDAGVSKRDLYLTLIVAGLAVEGGRSQPRELAPTTRSSNVVRRRGDKHAVNFVSGQLRTFDLRQDFRGAFLAELEQHRGGRVRQVQRPTAVRQGHRHYRA